MKARGRARARPEDRSGEDTRRREDTWVKTLPDDRFGEDRRCRKDRWAGEDISQRQASKDTGAKTLPEDRSGEDMLCHGDTRHRKNTRAREDNS